MTDTGVADTSAPAQGAPPPDVIETPPPVHAEPQKAEPAKKPSIHDSLAKSKEVVEKSDTKPVETKAKAEPKPDVKAPAKAETEEKPEKAEAVEPKAKPVQDRGDRGQFAGVPKEDDKTAAEAGDRSAPKRFKHEARALWDALDDETHGTLKDETHRAFRELEAGLEKHREGSKRYVETFKAFDDLARQSNVDPKATLEGYITIDKQLHSRDPQQVMRAINEVLNSAGVTPAQYASAIMHEHQQQGAQPQQQRQPQQQQTPDVARIVQDQVARAVAPIVKHLTAQQQSQHESVLSTWAADKPHFATLRGRITELVRDEGLQPDDAYATALNEAQEAARAFLGDAGGKSPSLKLADFGAERSVQTDKGSKQISGAPSGGSSPPARKPGPPIPPIRESLRKALAASR